MSRGFRRSKSCVSTWRVVRSARRVVWFGSGESCRRGQRTRSARPANSGATVASSINPATVVISRGARRPSALIRSRRCRRVPAPLGVSTSAQLIRIGVPVATLAGRPVHERTRRVEHRDLERRGGPAPVRDDVPDGEALPPRLDVAQPPSLARDRDLDPPREVPARPPLAELHDPRPDPLGRRSERGGAVDDHPGVGHDPVARQRRTPLPRRSRRSDGRAGRRRRAPRRPVGRARAGGAPAQSGGRAESPTPDGGRYRTASGTCIPTAASPPSQRAECRTRHVEKHDSPCRNARPTVETHDSPRWNARLVVVETQDSPSWKRRLAVVETQTRLAPQPRTPDLRWPRPPGRMSSCRLPTRPSSAIVPSSSPARRPNRSPRWRRTCGFPSRACGTGWPRPTSTSTAAPPQLTSKEKKELAELRRDKRRLEMEVEILKRAAAYFARENVLPN